MEAPRRIKCVSKDGLMESVKRKRGKGAEVLMSGRESYGREKKKVLRKVMWKERGKVERIHDAGESRKKKSCEV